MVAFTQMTFRVFPLSVEALRNTLLFQTDGDPCPLSSRGSIHLKLFSFQTAGILQSADPSPLFPRKRGHFSTACENVKARKKDEIMIPLQIYNFLIFIFLNQTTCP